ncbi:MAG: class I SAM-dependent rRNA methyltransferase [Halioglobus sp.]
MMQSLFLRKGADRRLRGGHLWVYSNEIDTQRSPLSAFSAGDLVAVVNASGTQIASAYMEPNTLICARVYAPGQLCEFDSGFIDSQLKRALSLRERHYEGRSYRLVYGDSDGLPGLVVDRYGDALVVQLNNAGLERYQAMIVDCLVRVTSPTGVLLRLDSRQRKEQGLPVVSEVVYGQVPEKVPFVENGVRFLAPVHNGQKTGWFYDHRNSRGRLKAWVAQKSVLDVYSYIGGWGVQAAAFGAQSVCCVDSSADALAGVMENAELNGVSQKLETVRGSAAESMAAMISEGRQFDVVILDPPAFITRRKDLKKGIAAYRRINELGLKLLSPGGLLVSASCSMHLPRADLISAIGQAAARVNVPLRIVEQGGQGADHPIHPVIPETEYLKAVFAVRD